MYANSLPIIRSAAYCKGKRYEEALTDADKVIDIKPDWAKVYQIDYLLFNTLLYSLKQNY